MPSQIEAVAAIMSAGEWWTLFDLQKEVYKRYNKWCSVTSLSARIRDLRKPEFGGHSVARERDESRPGTYLYKMEPS